MIQRIQTLFLLGAVIVSGLYLLFPLAEIVDGETIYQMSALNLVNLDTNEVIGKVYSLGILSGVSALISLMAIFLFKNRKLQMRFCMYNLLVLLALIAISAYYLYSLTGEYSDLVHIEIYAMLPVIALVLNWLAFRSIRKDEILIKSMDRIR